MLEIICMPMIVALVYALIELYKKAINGAKNAIFAKIIPIIACVLGVAAGVICYYCFPELIAAHNLATAILIGAASGLSATGCNQIFKQLKRYGIDVIEPAQPSNSPQQNLQSESTAKETLTDKSITSQQNLQLKNDATTIEKNETDVTKIAEENTKLKDEQKETTQDE